MSLIAGSLRRGQHGKTRKPFAPSLRRPRPAESIVALVHPGPGLSEAHGRGQLIGPWKRIHDIGGQFGVSLEARSERRALVEFGQKLVKRPFAELVQASRQMAQAFWRNCRRPDALTSNASRKRFMSGWIALRK